MSEHLEFLADVTVDASVEAGGEPKPRTFEFIAYNGGVIAQPWAGELVVDLDGMDVDAPDGQLQALVQHDYSQWAGVIRAEDVTNNGQTLSARGEFFDAGDASADLVVGKAKKAKWQASIGAAVLELEDFDEGETVKVNGRTFKGPVLVARKTALQEISFVPRGADSSTSAAVFAARTKPEEEASVADTEKPDALAAMRTRNKQIAAEFSSDAEFMAQALTSDDSIDTLRLQFAQRQLAAAKAEADAVKAELEAERNKPAPQPVVTASGIGGAPVNPGTAKDQLEAMVQDEIARLKANGVQPLKRVVRCGNHSTLKAMALHNLLRDNPKARELHAQWIPGLYGKERA